MLKRHLPGMTSLPAVALTAVLMLCACREDKKEFVDLQYDPETFATMTTTDVSTLISDSGLVRYRIDSPLWLVFDEAREPNWKFPDGLHMEKYDNMMRREATVDCDSALFLKNKQLWRLDGYVDIKNTAGEKFLTNQLFWDQRHEKVYSDSFIHIERADRIIEGYGFESNDRMTQYRVLNVSGIFPASQFTERGEDYAGEPEAVPEPEVVDTVSSDHKPRQAPDRLSGRQRTRRTASADTASAVAEQELPARKPEQTPAVKARRPLKPMKLEESERPKKLELSNQNPKK